MPRVLPAHAIHLQDQTVDVTYSVIMVHNADYAECMMCEKDLEKKVGVRLLDTKDAAMDEDICLTCFEDMTESGQARVVSG